jgi:protocatechuate 3,4-dioxygenase beta subunit
VALGVIGVGAVAAGAVGIDRALSTPRAEGALEPSRGCAALTPEQSVGPFYVHYNQLLQDITGGEAGVPLKLTIRIIDIQNCRPISRAALSIWHANAPGVYSDEAVERTTGRAYLRGTQITDARGQAEFHTIFPGWYTGPTQHIHVKVIEKVAVSQNAYHGGTVVHIGQIFFPQAVDDAIARVTPYASNQNAFVTNAQDTLYVTEGGVDSVLAPTGSSRSGFAGSIVFGINSDANYNNV